MDVLNWIITNGDRLSIVTILLLVIAGLAVVLYGGFKENPWWVFGTVYREQVKATEMWKALAINGTDDSRRMLQHLKKVVKTKAPPVERKRTPVHKDSRADRNHDT